MNKKDLAEKARVFLYAFLLMFVLGVLFLLIPGLAPSREALDSLPGILLLNTFIILPPALWAGWRIHTPSWRDGILFAILCLLPSTRSIGRIIHGIFSSSGFPGINLAIISLVSTFLFGICGVLAGGVLFRKKYSRK